jgi:hypothetical protein
MKSSLTLVPNDSDVGSCYVKRHEFLCLDDAEVTRTLSSMLAEEANILEALKPHPHRNISPPEVELSASRSKDTTPILQYRFEGDPRELELEACM